METKTDITKGLEESKRFLEKQGVNITALEAERKSMVDNLKRLDARVQGARSAASISPNTSTE